MSPAPAYHGWTHVPKALGGTDPIPGLGDNPILEAEGQITIAADLSDTYHNVHFAPFDSWATSHPDIFGIGSFNGLPYTLEAGTYIVGLNGGILLGEDLLNRTPVGSVRVAWYTNLEGAGVENGCFHWTQYDPPWDMIVDPGTSGLPGDYEIFPFWQTTFVLREEDLISGGNQFGLYGWFSPQLTDTSFEQTAFSLTIVRVGTSNPGDLAPPE